MNDVDIEYHTFTAFTKSFDWGYMTDERRLEHTLRTLNKVYELYEIESKQKRDTINRLMRGHDEREDSR